MTRSLNMTNALRGFLLLGLLALLLGGCRGFTFEKPPIHPNLNMDFQTHFGAQQEAPFWEDRRSMRPRPEGVVARGHLRNDSHLYEGRVDGGYASTLPMELTEDLLDRGQERYEIFCAPCHGAAGHGDAAIPSRSNWIVPTLHAERSRSMPVGQLYDIVANGVNTMPGYAEQIRVHDRWAIAAYVRALQVSQGLTLDEIPADIAAAQGWGRR